MQQISTTNHVIKRFRTNRGEHFAHFLRVEGNQIDDLIRIARELVTQCFVLCTHTNRARVGLALTYHNAAHRNQRSGADAVFLSTKHRGHDNVTTCAQTTVRA